MTKQNILFSHLIDHGDAVELLIENGANVTVDFYRDTLLHEVSYHGNYCICTWISVKMIFKF